MVRPITEPHTRSIQATGSRASRKKPNLWERPQPLIFAKVWTVRRSARRFLRHLLMSSAFKEVLHNLFIGNRDDASDLNILEDKG